jgi:hypothetical protein
MGCQKCIFFSPPPKIMVPWYTVEPPINGVCPKNCSCEMRIVDEYVKETLECHYDRYVTDITEQFSERRLPTKKSLRKSASSSYWHNKADQLCIRPDLMDLSAPLPPCVAGIVSDHIDSMLEDFMELEEWYFGFDKAPRHEKDDIVDGYVSGTYREIIKKRRDDRALALLAHSQSFTAAEDNPLFGPPTKKLRQTTLTQVFNEFPSADQSPEDCKPQAVVDLTNKKQLGVKDLQSKVSINVVIDLTNNQSSILAMHPQVAKDHKKLQARTPDPNHGDTANQSCFTTPPPHQKTRDI